MIKNFFRRIKKRNNEEMVKVILTTDENLSDFDKDKIKNIVRDGILSNRNMAEISFEIMRFAGIYKAIIIQNTKNGVEVTF